MSYKIIDLPDLGRQFNATDIIEVSANGTGSFKANIGDFTLGGENYIFVNANGTPEENGAAVRAAYTAAQAMTPNGFPISSANRIVILLAPGHYSFNEAVDGVFNINTSNIDFVSLSGVCDVYFSSIQIKSTSSPQINIYISGIDITKNAYYPHASFAIASSGGIEENIVVKNCIGGDYSFSSFSRGFRGLYENCNAGNYSFCSTGDSPTPPVGILSTATGNFQNYGNIISCTSPNFSFVSGFNVPAGTIINYGTIKNCTSNALSFCYSDFRAVNFGIIDGCVSGDYSLCAVSDSIGTGSAVNSGKIINCRTFGAGICLYGGSSFDNASAQNTGLISNCYVEGGVSACVINDGPLVGNNSGQILNCFVDGAGFCGQDGVNSGNIIECTALDSSFCSGNPIGISGQILRCTLLDWTFTVGTPTGSGRVVLGIDTTGVVNY